MNKIIELKACSVDNLKHNAMFSTTPWDSKSDAYSITTIGDTNNITYNLKLENETLKTCDADRTQRAASDALKGICK
jgi:hypothetical protein